MDNKRVRLTAKKHDRTIQNTVKKKAGGLHHKDEAKRKALHKAVLNSGFQSNLQLAPNRKNAERIRAIPKSYPSPFPNSNRPSQTVSTQTNRKNSNPIQRKEFREMQLLS